MARVEFFDRDSHILRFLVHVEKEHVDTAWFFTSRMGPPRIQWLSASAHVARVVLVDRDSHSMHLLVDVGREHVDVAWFFAGRMPPDTVAIGRRACGLRGVI